MIDQIQVVIDKDKIEQIVDKLIAVGVSTCDRAPRATVTAAVVKWLENHIDNIVQDADWWVRKEADLHEYGLPYEDELELKPEFLNWNFRYMDCEDGRKHWAEFHFSNPKLVEKSPTYDEGASDFHCLREDAVKVAKLLKEGADWEEVCGKFRQAW
ncbi:MULTISPECIES: hypothetical protein [Nostocales]|uniref:Uncharacterized protein n=1 Tax=Tolypothrix bouteillei VB521301 TaxID=1479485 RepID=A0A0C1QWK2_9CYAN